ncbi:MAG: GNAT family N-acetyltransferase [Anaerolineales bacterium]|nr:GNAT family N-acetyltransferase [Anaerolineales bacterium]
MATLTLEYTPQIFGLEYRYFEGESDFEKIVTLDNVCALADELDYINTVEKVKNDFTHLVNCDPFQDVLLATIEDQVVAKFKHEWREEPGESIVYSIWGNVHPDWRGREIQNPMLDLLEKRGASLSKDNPSPLPRNYRSFAYSTEFYKQKSLEKRGYKPSRYFIEMIRPIGTPLNDHPLPEGLEFRPMTIENVDQVMTACDTAFRDHWGYSPITEEDRKGWLEHPTTDIKLWKVAWDGDKVAGMVLNFLDKEENEVWNRKRGYTETIAVLREYRKKGVAKAIITESIRMFAEMDMEETALGVDAVNPSGALQLYEYFGYQETKREIVFEKEFTS